MFLADVTLPPYRTVSPDMRTNARSNGEFDRLTDQPVVVLTTFRKNGIGVPTPVHIVVNGGRAYFRTWNTTGKAKRLAREPRVEVAPSTFFGKPTGTPIKATARLLPHGDPMLAWIRRALPRKHKLMQPLVPMLHRLAGRKTLYYELSTRE